MYVPLALPIPPSLTSGTDVWIDGDGGLRSKTTVRPRPLSPSPPYLTVSSTRPLASRSQTSANSASGISMVHPQTRLLATTRTSTFDQLPSSRTLSAAVTTFSSWLRRTTVTEHLTEPTSATIPRKSWTRPQMRYPGLVSNKSTPFLTPMVHLMGGQRVASPPRKGHTTVVQVTSSHLTGSISLIANRLRPLRYWESLRS